MKQTKPQQDRSQKKILTGAILKKHFFNFFMHSPLQERFNAYTTILDCIFTEASASVRRMLAVALRRHQCPHNMRYCGAQVQRASNECEARGCGSCFALVHMQRNEA